MRVGKTITQLATRLVKIFEHAFQYLRQTKDEIGRLNRLPK